MSQPNISTEDCWLWAGRQNELGYGRYGMKIGNKWRERFAHRLMYESVNGEIPPGLVIDHLCRVPTCVNPEHLEAVTNKENIRRGIGPSTKNSKKTHCVSGHPFSGSNLRVSTNGSRYCGACNSIRLRKNRNKYPYCTEHKMYHGQKSSGCKITEYQLGKSQVRQIRTPKLHGSSPH